MRLSIPDEHNLIAHRLPPIDVLKAKNTHLDVHKNLNGCTWPLHPSATKFFVQ